MDNKYMNHSVCDGFVDQAVCRSRVFKKTVNFGSTENAGDKLASGVEYALFNLPNGFLPRFVVVNVIEANTGASTLTIKASKKGGASESVATSSTASVAAVGKTLINVDTPWLCEDGDTMTVTASADTDAKFEVVAVGDFVDLA